MSECQLNFTSADHDLSYKVYQELRQAGVSCDEMDQGETIISDNGRDCPQNQTSCTIGRKDNRLTAGEVLDYTFTRYQKYQKILEGALDEKLPWVLDDLNPGTSFDAEVRGKVNQAILEIKKLLHTKGIKEGSGDYRKKMAIALYYFAATSRKTVLSQETPMAENAVDELSKEGLGEFQKYLQKFGGLKIQSSRGGENTTALEALKGDACCLEKSDILFALFEMAGLSPIFVTAGRNEHLMGIYAALTIDGKLRIFAPYSDTNLQYERVIPLPLKDRLASTRRERGLSFERKSLWDSAAFHYSKALELNPRDTTAYRWRGDVRFSQQQWDRAIEDYTKAISINPKDDIAFYKRGLSWSDKNDPQKAIDDFTTAQQLDPKNASAFAERGNSWLSLCEWNKAIVDYSEAIKLRNWQVLYYHTRGTAYMGNREWDKALADLNLAILKNPKDGEIFNNRGMVWDEKKEYDKAIADYSEALKLKPNDPDILVNRAVSWMHKQNWDKAIADFAEALRIESKSFLAYLNRGLMWTLKKDWDKAISDFTEILKYKPFYASVYNERGLAWAEKSEWQKALNDFSEAIQIKPDFSEAYTNRAKIFEKLGFTKKATADREQAKRATEEEKKEKCTLLIRSGPSKTIGEESFFGKRRAK